MNIKKEKISSLEDIKRLKQDKQALEVDLEKMNKERSRPRIRLLTPQVRPWAGAAYLHIHGCSLFLNLSNSNWIVWSKCCSLKYILILETFFLISCNRYVHLIGFSRSNCRIKENQGLFWICGILCGMTNIVHMSVIPPRLWPSWWHSLSFYPWVWNIGSHLFAKWTNSTKFCRKHKDKYGIPHHGNQR